MLHTEKSSVRTWLSSGELWIWMNAAAVGISIAAVGGLLALIAVRGLAHFWPADIAEIQYLTANGQPAVAVRVKRHEGLTWAGFKGLVIGHLDI